MCGKPCEFSTQLVLNKLMAVKRQKNEQYILIENDQIFRLGRFSWIDMIPFADLDSYLFCMFVGRSGRVKEGGGNWMAILRGKALRKHQLLFMSESHWTYNLIRQGGIFSRVKNRFSTVGTDEDTGLTLIPINRIMIIMRNN